MLDWIPIDSDSIHEYYQRAVKYADEFSHWLAYTTDHLAANEGTIADLVESSEYLQQMSEHRQVMECLSFVLLEKDQREYCRDCNTKLANKAKEITMTKLYYNFIRERSSMLDYEDKYYVERIPIP